MSVTLPLEILPDSSLSNRAASTEASREDNRFDILRLLAAWLVLFSHCYPLGGRLRDEPLAKALVFDNMGGVGLAIFFVLSGYLITISIERSPSLLEFAWRRALRIFPGLLVICLLSIFVLGPLMTSLPLADYWRSSMTWNYLQSVSAIRIRFELPGVFTDNPVAGAVNGSLWSMPYEITCYLVLAAIALLPGPLRIKVALVAFGLAVLLLLRMARPPASDFHRVMMLDFFQAKLGLLFALGAVFACWRGHIRPLAWPALLALAAVWFKLASGGEELLLFLGGVAMLTLWLALKARWLPRIPPRIGDWSYGAYLYAFPVQQVMAYYKLHEGNFWLYVTACTVVTFGLAGLSWHLVEKQALRWK